ncbi:MAG: TlpA disulfide reductase family protein [Pyrinomonadaceae bacterium]
MSSSQKSPDMKKKFWSPRRVIATLFVLSLIAAFGISSCHSNDEPYSTNGKPGDKPTVSVTKTSPPAPASNAPPALLPLPASVRDAQLTAIDGSAFRLADFSGKVLLVNLWATWCGPCRQEMPELVKLYKEYKSQGLEIVGLTTEDPESSGEMVKSFVRANAINYRIGWASNELAGTLMQGRNSIPQSYIISRDGFILKRFVGFSPVQTPPQLRQAIEEALHNKGKP